MVFCNMFTNYRIVKVNKVTILILIDGFLQFPLIGTEVVDGVCHNPYFNRWFSAIARRGVKNGKTAVSQSLF